MSSIIAQCAYAGSPETRKPRYTKIYVHESVVKPPFTRAPNHFDPELDDDESGSRPNKNSVAIHAAIGYAQNTLSTDFYDILQPYRFGIAIVQHRGTPEIDFHGFNLGQTNDAGFIQLEDITSFQFHGGNIGQNSWGGWALVGAQKKDIQIQPSSLAAFLIMLELENLSKAGVTNPLETFLSIYPLKGPLQVYSPSLDHLIGKAFDDTKF